MSIQTFNKSVKQAHRICEDAAAVVELTQQAKNETTTFVFPAAGLLYGQVVTELRNRVSPRVQVALEGDNIRVVTNNPTVCVQALKALGVSVTVQGELLADVHTRTPPADTTSTTA